MYSSIVIGQAVLFALGVYWCYEVIGRWRSDLEELRDVNDTTRRVVILVLWFLTLLIALATGYFAFRLLANIITGVRDLL